MAEFEIDGYRVLVDDLPEGSWYIAEHGYVRHTVTDEYLHRVVMGLKKGDGLYVDHLNKNRLDNRKENLRVCTQSENMQNIGAHRDSQSGVRGVHPSGVTSGRWVAQRMVNGVRRTYGTFSTIEEAAEALERG